MLCMYGYHINNYFLVQISNNNEIIIALEMSDKCQFVRNDQFRFKFASLFQIQYLKIPTFQIVNNVWSAFLRDQYKELQTQIREEHEEQIRTVNKSTVQLEKLKLR